MFGIAVFVELMIAVLGTSLKALDTHGPHVTVGYGSPGEIGALLLDRFLLPFELASFLLLVAAVGAVALAGRRGGIPEDEILAPERTVDPSHGLSPSPMPASAGTMAEGVAGYGVTQPLPEPSEEVLAMNISWYLVVSSLMFVLGAVGVLIRRNPLVVLLCLELMLNAGNLALLGFARMWADGDGQIFAIVVMVVAACEVAIGLGIIVALYRQRLPVDVDELRELHG